jgi:hypothetical protein
MAQLEVSGAVRPGMTFTRAANGRKKTPEQPKRATPLAKTDRGKLAMDALGYVIEDLGPENLINNFGGQSEHLQPFT